MKKALIISSIKPSPINNGEPSGLIDIVIKELKKDFLIDFKLISAKRKINKLSFFIKQVNYDLDLYDFILIYPFHAAFAIKNKKQNKSFVLGPDATSLVWKRRSKIHGRLDPKRYLFQLISFVFCLREKHLYKKGVTHIVVGKNDENYLTKHGIVNTRYLPHPIIEPEISNQSLHKIECPTFVIAGHYSKDMLCNSSVKKINKELSGKDLLIVGKRNKWITTQFPNLKCSYISFIENYKDICRPNKHVHLCPIAFGGGTKNRVLSALNYGCLVFGTEIANENIIHPNLKGIQVLTSETKFEITNVEGYRANLNELFRTTLSSIINEKN